MEKAIDPQPPSAWSVNAHDRARLQACFHGTPRSFRRWYQTHGPDDESPRISDKDLEARTRQEKIWAIAPGDTEWPKSIDDLSDPPVVLYARGRPFPVGPRLAVVGSRTEDPFTHRMCRRVVGHWATIHPQGAILSGGGLGVDQVALSTALRVGLHPVACLAGDLSRPTPRSLTPLFDQILEYGTLISEAFPGTPCFPYLFPDRNRLIAALSDIVVVIRAAENSGSLNTLEHAVKIGRPVFGVPGPIDDPGWHGLHGAFDAQKAKPLFRLEDLCNAQIPNRRFSTIPPDMTKKHHLVIKLLEREPATIDTVSAILRLTVTDVMQMMLDLELANIVCRRRDDTFETRLESEKACQN